MDERQEAQAVVAKVEAPCEPQKKMKVLVAVDESEASLYALSWALDNLFSTSHDIDCLVLLHVQQPFQSFAYPAGPVYASAGVFESVKVAQRQNSEALLARAHGLCKNKLQVQTHMVIMDGDPKDMICEVVDNMHIDLAVLGSRGLGQIKRAFLGSVSDYCAHHAKCPILIVKPPKQQQQQ